MKKTSFLTLSILLTLVLLCGLMSAAFATDGDAEAILFTDSALESKIRASIGKPDGQITLAEAGRIDNLNLSNENKEGLDDDQLIHDLSDLRYFPNLFKLSIVNNAVTDISALGGMSGMKYLDLGGNAITDLGPLSSLPLEELGIWGNGITDLSPLANVTTLKRLTANDNRISDFTPLSGLSSLEALFVRMNAGVNYAALSGIAPKLSEKDFEILTTPYDPAEVIAFGDPVFERRVREFLNLPEGPITAGDAAYITALDLSNPWGEDVPDEARFEDISPLRYFVNLNELYLARNNVHDISALKDLKSLISLRMSDNDVLDFSPLAGLTLMQYLSIDGRGRDLGMLSSLTGLVELDIGSGNKSLPEWLPNLTQLVSFGSAGGELTDISLLALCPSLTSVNLGWNRISDIAPLSGLPLTRLYLTQNQVSDLAPLSGMPLTCLYLAGNPITDYAPIRGIYEALQEKDFDAVFADDIPETPLVFADARFEKALREALNIHDRPITTRDAYTVLRLEVHSEKSEAAMFSDITPLEAFVNLTELKFNANKVADLSPLAHLTKLTRLDLNFQQIKDLAPLAGLSELRWLNLRNNRIIDLTPLAGLIRLDSLDICENQIIDLTPLQSLSNLRRLMVEGNQIFDFSAVDALLPNLQETDIPKVPEDVPDEPLPNLDPNLAPILARAIGREGQPITQRDVYRISKLTLNAQVDGAVGTIDISALAYFKNLQRIDIANLPVSDLSPLVGLPKLNWLVVAEGALTDLSAVAQMTGLRGLEVQGNEISDVAPIAKLTELDYLNVSNNSITDLSPLLGLKKLTILFMNNNPAGDVSQFAELASRLRDKDFDPERPLKDSQEKVVGQADAVWREPENPAEVVTFKDKKLKMAVTAILGIEDREITLADTYAVKTLDFTQVKGGDKKFSDLSPLASFANLEELRLVGNGIKSIKFLAGLNNLRRLQLDMQNITDISTLSGLAELDYVSIKESKISDIQPLAGLSKLRCLDLTGNKIKDVTPLSTCPALEMLFLSKNQITDLSPFGEYTDLITLHLVKNKIKDVSPLVSLDKLQGLMLGGNKIKDFSPLAGIYVNLLEKDFALP